MLQRVAAVALAVLGLSALVFAGLAGTVWKPDTQVVAGAVTPSGATMMVTEPGVLELVDETVTVTVTRADGGPVSVAIGSEPDVLGWVGEDAHGVATGLTDWSHMSAGLVEGKTVPVETQTPTDSEGSGGSGLVGADPSDSDMWVAQDSGDGTASVTWTVPKGRFLALAASVGDDAPPPQVTFKWERQVSTPLVLPAIVVGVLLLLGAGVVFLRAPRPAKARKGATARVKPVEVGLEPETVASEGQDGPHPHAAEPLPHAAQSDSAVPQFGSREPVIADGRLVRDGHAVQDAHVAWGAPGHSHPQQFGREEFAEPEFSPVAAASAAAAAAAAASGAAAGEQPPMSRRQLRELAEQQAAAQARARRTGRRRPHEEPQVPASAPAGQWAGQQPEPAPVQTPSVGPEVYAPASAGQQSGYGQQGPYPQQPGHAQQTPAQPLTIEEQQRLQDHTRADAWRRAWGFQQGWEQDAPAGQAGTGDGDATWQDWSGQQQDHDNGGHR